MKNDDIVAKIEEYINNFWIHHEDEYQAALKDAHLSYQISSLRHFDDRMARIEDIINNIDGNIGVVFYKRPLIPAAFPSLQTLILGFMSLVSELDGYIKYILQHYGSVLPSHVDSVLRICCGLKSFCEEVERISIELDIPSAYIACRNSLYADDVDGFLERVNQILAKIPYSVFKQNVNESFFQVSLLLLLTLLGFSVNAEDATSKGRIDATLDINHIVYIFEFKYSKVGKNLSNIAYRQIIKKGYAEKFKLQSRQIKAIGVSFSAKTRNINGRCIDEFV